MARLREDPGDRDAAFDLFVTAESLTEYRDADERFKHSKDHGSVGCLLVAPMAGRRGIMMATSTEV